LLLLHGFSSSPAVFRRLQPALPHYDAIVCPVLPGHGDSIAAFSLVKATDWVLAAEAVCAALMKDYQHVDVVGLSLGGLLACHLSQRFKLHHLYLLAPALALQLPIKLALVCAHLLRGLGFKRVQNRAGNLNSKQYNELAYCQLPITAIIEILTLINTFQFIEPTCPTDLFLGRSDGVVYSKQVENLFAHLPKVNRHWLENSAHVLPLDADVEQIISCIRDNF
jgi:carboxylesterase